MTRTVSFALLIVACLGMGWVFFDYLETGSGGLFQWVPFAFALILAGWAVGELISD